ncbi:MAG: sugar phosphate isomerase/epimerase [Chloroflexi bacterium]|nr:sugar phosphate isomerase/epimerase [Chloroflexota bacterium]
MRFGIMEMQLDALVPSGITAAQAQEHLLGFDHAGFIRSLADKGFKIIELNGDLPIFFPNVYLPTAVEALAALKTEQDLAYTVHLPLWSIEPSTPQNPVREGSVEAITRIIQATQSLQPETYVLHATGALAAEFYRMHLPESARPLILRLFQANAIASLKTILSRTGISPRKIAIESIEFPLELTWEIAEQVDCSFCVDTGHLLAGFSGDIDPFEALEQCLPRLAEIHLHDSPWYRKTRQIGYGKDHQPLGQGDLDVARLLDQLDQNHFSGPLIFELSIDQALSSLETIRSIRPEAVDNP